MITGKLNLLMLNGVVKKMKAKSGEIDCLILPIENNNFFKGEKGVYLDLVAFELKTKREDSRDTHIVKQSLSKEKRESMTQDELSAMPILGNLSVSTELQSQEPNINPEPIDEPDDLPF